MRVCLQALFSINCHHLAECRFPSLHPFPQTYQKSLTMNNSAENCHGVKLKNLHLLLFFYSVNIPFDSDDRERLY